VLEAGGAQLSASARRECYNYVRDCADNAARRFGVLVYGGADGLILADQEFERLKKEI